MNLHVAFRAHTSLSSVSGPCPESAVLLGNLLS